MVKCDKGDNRVNGVPLRIRKEERLLKIDFARLGIICLGALFFAFNEEVHGLGRLFGFFGWFGREFFTKGTITDDREFYAMHDNEADECEKETPKKTV